MTKRHRRKKPNVMTEVLSVRLTPETKLASEIAGDSDFWRKIITANAEAKLRLQAGKITPDEFRAIIAAETARITGIE
jgi:hypothetical protein